MAQTVKHERSSIGGLRPLTCINAAAVPGDGLDGGCLPAKSKGKEARDGMEVAEKLGLVDF